MFIYEENFVRLLFVCVVKSKTSTLGRSIKNTSDWLISWLNLLSFSSVINFLSVFFCSISKSTFVLLFVDVKMNSMRICSMVFLFKLILSSKLNETDRFSFDLDSFNRVYAAILRDVRQHRSIDTVSSPIDLSRIRSNNFDKTYLQSSVRKESIWIRCSHFYFRLFEVFR